MLIYLRPSFLVALVVFGLSGCITTKPYDRGPAAIVSQPVSQSNIKDASIEFAKVFCAINADHGEDLYAHQECEESLHLSDEIDVAELTPIQNRLRVFIVPGIFGECVAEDAPPFLYAREHIVTHGNIRTSVIPGIRGRASSNHNARVLAGFFRSLPYSKEKTIVIAYSKGTTDMLTFLAKENDETVLSKIDALVALAGVVNGAPLADQTDQFLHEIAEHLPLEKCPLQDDVGISDLKQENQLARLSASNLPTNIKYFSLPAYADQKDVSAVMYPTYRYLSTFDVRNDGQVIISDAVIPSSTLLGYANGDHWAIILPFARRKDAITNISSRAINALTTKNDYPREVLLESIVRFVDTEL